jgi:general L-amino acid transport system substrate-binding protein
MKLKLWLLCTLFIFAANSVLADDAGLRYITTRGTVKCGTESENKIFVHKDTDGKLNGFDVEICRMLSTAIFGKNDRITMVPLSANQVSKAIETNKIDVMIGGLPYSATTESGTRTCPVSVMYYDNQVFLARPLENAESMQSYKGARVCVVNESDDLSKLKTYNDQYQLDFNILPFPNLSKAKEAFFLKRCQLLTANSLLLKDIMLNSPAGTTGVEILPEVIVSRPVYIYTDKNNPTMRSIIKWVINASRLAEEYGINSDNIGLFSAAADTSTQNLLGLNKELWQKFGLEPTWLQTSVKESGNYGEIFENTLGSNSKYNFMRGKSNLITKGGWIITDPFL